MAVIAVEGTQKNHLFSFFLNLNYLNLFNKVFNTTINFRI